MTKPWAKYESDRTLEAASSVVVATTNLADIIERYYYSSVEH